jgi:hypothetical protein
MRQPPIFTRDRGRKEIGASRPYVLRYAPAARHSASGRPLMAVRRFLIPRRPQGGRLAGRTASIQLIVDFFTRVIPGTALQFAASLGVSGWCRELLPSASCCKCSSLTPTGSGGEHLRWLPTQ